MKKIRIAQIGTFDCENMGDLLFPFVLEKAACTAESDILVDIFSPIGGKMPFSPERPVFKIRELGRMHHENPYNAFVIGGGDLVRLDSEVASKEKYNTLDATLWLWVYPIILGFLERVPVLFNAPGVPFRFLEKQSEVVRYLLELTDYVAVRDVQSREFLLDSGFNGNIQVVPDTVNLVGDLFPKECLPFESLYEKFPEAKEETYVCFQLNSLEGRDKLNEYAEVIRQLHLRKNCQVYLMPIGYVHDDVSVLGEIYDYVSCKMDYVRMIHEKLTPFEMMALLSNASAFVGTSLHGSVISFSYGVPILAINNSHLSKIDGFYSMIDAQERVCASIHDVQKKIEYIDTPCNYEKYRVTKQVRNHFDWLFYKANTKKENPEEDILGLMSNIILGKRALLSSSVYWKGNKEEFTQEKSAPLHVRRFEKNHYDFERVSLPADTYSLRFDPCDGYECAVVLNARATTNLGQFMLNPVGVDFSGKYVFFPTNDPQMVFNTDEPIAWVEFSADILPLSAEPATEILCEAIRSRAVIETENQENESKISVLDDTVNALRRENQENENKISVLDDTVNTLRMENQALGDAKARFEADNINLLAKNKYLNDGFLRVYKLLVHTEMPNISDNTTTDLSVIKSGIQQIEYELNALRNTSDALREECDSEREIIHLMQNSFSWRITTPMRQCGVVVRKLLGVERNLDNPSVIWRGARYLKKHGISATIRRLFQKRKNKQNHTVERKPAFDCDIWPKDYSRKTSSFPMIHGGDVEIPVIQKTVSVVIPTKNGGADFKRLMQMLLLQKGFRKVEVIIVDSGSVDGTVNTAENFGAKVIEIKPEDFSHSYARNLGIKNATGDYILVMTQDAMPTSKYWIYNMYQALNRELDVGAVSCGEYPRADADLYHRAFTWHHYRFINSYQNDSIKTMPKSDDIESMHSAAQLSDIACFMSVDTARGYPYRGSFAEDLDLGMRLLKDGKKVGFLGHELAIHSHNRPAYYYLRRRFVELLTFKEIFPNQQIIPYTYNGVVKEAVYVAWRLNDFFIYDVIAGRREPVSVEEFRTDFMRAFHGMSAGSYPKDIVLESDMTWLDTRTSSLLSNMSKQYSECKFEEKLYTGSLLPSIEGYLNILFNYMGECYELVNIEVFQEFKECIGKIYAGALGTFFAYSKLSDADSAQHNNFYEEIGSGV